MENGKQVVAKVPNPNAGPGGLTTASEARDVLETPVPKVYAWNSEAQSNAVGAEYIIMQKAPGVQLEHVWTKMEIEDRLEVVKKILRYQKKWASISFEQFGSLYFAHDLGKQNSHDPFCFDEHGTAMKNRRFAVGPSTGREYYDAGRASVYYDRGPWDSVEDYLAAIGNREIICVEKISRLPKSPITLRGPGTYMTCREKKLKALQSYLTIANYLLPIDRSIASSCLWHPDLHQENIFVKPENPSEIVAIIDWQSTELAPLFNQARQPYFVDYEGPPTQGLRRPELPDNYDQLDDASQKKAKSLYLSQMFSTMYRVLLRNKALLLYRAWEYQETASFDLLLIAQRLLIDGEAQYLASILELENDWSDLPGVVAQSSPPYPFHFSAAERAEIETDAKGAAEGMNLMRSVRDSIGRDLFPEKGMVRADQYDEAKDALRQMKEQVLDMYAHDEHERKLWEQEWPFDD
ncbi:MAG: hypothetical protein Q9225_007290 [Loekoesia sp. 1 TL-2023]